MRKFKQVESTFKGKDTIFFEKQLVKATGTETISPTELIAISEDASIGRVSRLTRMTRLAFDAPTKIMNGHDHATHQEIPFQVALIDRRRAAEGQIHCVEKPLQGDLKFVALSYRWGELHESMVDTKLGYIAIITSFSLDDFYRLCKMMEYDPDLKHMDYVWVDAICVDQSNHDRRKATIYHMSEIYEYANYILAVPDLHLQHLKDTSTTTQTIIEYYSDHVEYLYHHFHGCFERLYELDEAFLDDIGVPKHPDIRQWLTDRTEFLTTGFTKYTTHMGAFNPVDALEHACEVIQDVYQIPTPTSSTNSSSRNPVDGNVDDLVHIDYNVHYCNKAKCPLENNPTFFLMPLWQKAEYPKGFNSRSEANGWARKILERSTKIRQVIKRFMDLTTDWSTRVWVISELSIARKKNNLKYWFLHLSEDSDSFYRIATAPGFSFYNFDFDNPAVSFIEGRKSGSTMASALFWASEPICQEFHNLMIKQLKEQTFLEKMLKSKASRHEDRFYAVLPSSRYKYKLKDRDVVSSWNIQSLMFVKLKLYEWMPTKDKLNLLFLSGNWYSLIFSPILPTFATSNIGWKDDGALGYPAVDDNGSDCNFDLDNSDTIQLVTTVASGSSRYCLRIKPKVYYMATAATAMNYFAEHFAEYDEFCERLQINNRKDVNFVYISSDPDKTISWDSVSNIVFLIGSMAENKWELHKARSVPVFILDFEKHNMAPGDCFTIY